MRPVHFCLAVMAVSLLALSNRAAAQHATANDIADGERAYGQTCVVCHGPDGNLIEGIDLGRGLFRRDYTDAELLGIIIDGIPNTPMPPNPTMSEPQAERIVAYLRTMADESRDGAVAGDARRGRQLFFGDGNCTDCHAVAGAGNRHGPDLSNVGRQRRAIEIEASLTDPAARVEPTGRTVSVTLGNGDDDDDGCHRDRRCQLLDAM